MENFIITITYLVLGMILKRIPKFPGDTATSLNMFIIYVSLPALVMLKIPEMTISMDALVPVFMPWLMLGVSAVLVLLLAKALSWGREITGCMLLMVPLGNTSFLGIPMIKAFFGSQAIPYAVIYDQLGSFLALATYGSIVLALYGRAEARQSARDIVIKIVTFPPFIALVAAVSLRPFEYPEVLVTILNALSATLVPVVMIAVGFQLTVRLSPETFKPMAAGLGIKLMAAPLVALALCLALGLESEAARVSIMEAGMPPMVSAGALAIMAGLAPELTAALVGAGIILSFLSLPLLSELMKHLF